MKSPTLDTLQTKLWELHADLSEDKPSTKEVKNEIHSIVIDLETIIALHDLWNVGKPEINPNDNTINIPPIKVDEFNNIVDGTHRYKAAKELGFTDDQIPTEKIKL